MIFLLVRWARLIFAFHTEKSKFQVSLLTECKFRRATGTLNPSVHILRLFLFISLFKPAKKEASFKSDQWPKRRGEASREKDEYCRATHAYVNITRGIIRARMSTLRRPKVQCGQRCEVSEANAGQTRSEEGSGGRVGAHLMHTWFTVESYIIGRVCAGRRSRVGRAGYPTLARERSLDDPSHAATAQSDSPARPTTRRDETRRDRTALRNPLTRRNVITEPSLKSNPALAGRESEREAIAVRRPPCKWRDDADSFARASGRIQIAFACLQLRLGLLFKVKCRGDGRIIRDLSDIRVAPWDIERVWFLWKLMTR